MDISKTKVLVVEDSTTMRQLISTCLRDIGFQEIYAAGNGFEALPFVDQADLIISDWDMPEMDGLALLQEVRSRSDCHQLPFLMLTAVANKNQVRAAIQAGVSGYLCKPFQPKQLNEHIIKMLDQVKPRTESGPGFEDLTDI